MPAALDLGNDSADVAAIATRVLSGAPEVGATRLVCIDGPAGSGKTSLATALVGVLEPLVGEVTVVHGDDLDEGWAVVAGEEDRALAFGVLARRLAASLLTPWARGEHGEHPVWDWYSGARTAPRVLAAPAVAVLEGVGLAAAPLRAQATLSIWVSAGPRTRLDRVLARDGDDVREEMLSWQVDEQRWFDADATRAGCDLRLAT